jgi:hypothetical protein
LRDIARDNTLGLYVTLLYVFGIVLLGAVTFWWWQGVSAMNALERGDHGPFKVTRTSGAGDSYLAVDSDNQKLALVNIRVPEFNAREELTNHRNMTVVFPFADLASVSATRNESVTTVHFLFVKPVPPWNVHKQLTYVSGEGIRAFFEKYVPEIKVAYFAANKHGGVDPW